MELHEAQNDYPLATARLDVQVKMLSDNQVELRTHYKMSRSAHSTTHSDLLLKSKYLLHYLNLRLYLDHGMRLRDVPMLLLFLQSRWLAAYIEKNSTLPAAPKNDFAKEFFK